MTASEFQGFGRKVMKQAERHFLQTEASAIASSRTQMTCTDYQLE